MRAIRALFLVLIAAASPPAGATPPHDALETALPRVWSGNFHWRGGPAGLPQHYAIEFTCIEKRADGKIEATGPAEVRTGQVNRIDVRAIIDPVSRAVEMFEIMTPATGLGFTTDGAHRGALDADLRRMRLEWTQNGSGAKGDLVLTAEPDATGRIGGDGAAKPCRQPGA
mgnify:CR=1 FL=1